MLRFNKKLYSRKVLEDTKKAFKEICLCDIKEGPNYFNVSLVSKEDIKDNGFEFANYASALMG